MTYVKRTLKTYKEVREMVGWTPIGGGGDIIIGIFLLVVL